MFILLLIEVAPEVPIDVFNVNPISSGFPNILNYLPMTLGALVAFFSALILLILLRKFTWNLSRVIYAVNKVVLLITVPQSSPKDQEQIKNANDTKEAIAVAETLFSVVGGLKPDSFYKSFLFGRQDSLALEIVAQAGLVSFYIVVPKKLRQHIEQQIHAQYQHADVQEVDDYNIFTPHGHVLGSYLVFRRSYIFPIKTYKKIDSDPLSALVNSLSKIQGSDGAVIQLMVRSAHKSWRKLGAKTAKEVQKGKKVENALESASSSLAMKLLNGVGSFISAIFSGFKSTDKTSKEEPYKMTQIEEEMVKGIEEKSSKAGFDVNIRLVVSSKDQEIAKQYLANIQQSFSQFNFYEYGNTFVNSGSLFGNTSNIALEFIYRNFNESKKILLNSEELASMYHLPLSGDKTANIRWLLAKKYPAPINLSSDGVILGVNDYRRDKRLVRLKKDDRRRHVYIIGTTGSGKSTFMQEMAKQDIRNGEGVCVIDPHGSLIEDILPCIPPERAEDVILFDPADIERPIGLNMLEAYSQEEKDFVSQEMISIFYKLVTDPAMIGPMFEHNMRNAMLTLMADEEYMGTLVDIPRIFTDSDFQKYKLQHVKDVMVRAFWEKEIAKTTDYHKSEMLGYLISKVGRFVENEMVRNIIGQSKSGFNFREVMDQKKILLVNLSKGKIGEMPSFLLGLIIVSKLQIAAFSRAESLGTKDHPDFYLYIDEFQNFVTDTIATILSEARKYKLNLIMAHQYIAQLTNGQDTKIRDAVFGNVGTMVAFRVGVDDAELIAKQFAPIFNEYDVINIEKFNAYVRLLVDNTASRAFNLKSSPPSRGDPKMAETIRELSRLKYGVRREEISAEIIERSKLGSPTEE